MLKKTLIVPACLLVILFSGCQKESDPEILNGTDINKTLLLQLVNNYRTNGCTCGEDYFAPTTTLVWNNTLELVAHDHSSDMYKNNLFSHTGSDGSDPGNRVTRRNYDWITCGENIAKGYPTEQNVIKGWIDSPGHCKNIMNPNFREMGVSKVGDYWTQVFGAQK